jgi:hypothetical protein
LIEGGGFGVGRGEGVEFDGLAGGIEGGGVVAVEVAQDGEDVPGFGGVGLELGGLVGEGEALGDVGAAGIGVAGEGGGGAARVDRASPGKRASRRRKTLRASAGRSWSSRARPRP